MMKASAASGNAVLAKARALYGRRLRADDYRRLMGCRTMTELAAALKEYPLYADALTEVNPQARLAGCAWRAKAARTDRFCVTIHIIPQNVQIARYGQLYQPEKHVVFCDGTM